MSRFAPNEKNKALPKNEKSFQITDVGAYYKAAINFWFKTT